MRCTSSWRRILVRLAVAGGVLLGLFATQAWPTSRSLRAKCSFSADGEDAALGLVKEMRVEKARIVPDRADRKDVGQKGVNRKGEVRRNVGQSAWTSGTRP